MYVNCFKHTRSEILISYSATFLVQFYKSTLNKKQIGFKTGLGLHDQLVQSFGVNLHFFTI